MICAIGLCTNEATPHSRVWEQEHVCEDHLEQAREWWNSSTRRWESTEHTHTADALIQVHHVHFFATHDSASEEAQAAVNEFLREEQALREKDSKRLPGLTMHECSRFAWFPHVLMGLAREGRLIISGQTERDIRETKHDDTHRVTTVDGAVWKMHPPEYTDDLQATVLDSIV